MLLQRLKDRERKLAMKEIEFKSKYERAKRLRNSLATQIVLRYEQLMA
jgi:hypothetical protein